MSIVIVIISILLSAIIISRSLIVSAKINETYREIVDFNKLTIIFTNEYGCVPGNCPATSLPSKIIDKTPSGCFNLSTTTGMGNAATNGNSPGTTTASATKYIANFSTNGIIDSNAKRTCAFYEMQAFEPSGFGGSATAKKHNFDSILGVQSANAIGVRKLDIANNPIITASITAKTQTMNTQIAANNTIITNTVNDFNTNLATLNNNLSQLTAISTYVTAFETMSSTTNTSTLFNLKNLCDSAEFAFYWCMDNDIRGISSVGGYNYNATGMNSIGAYTYNITPCDPSTGQISAEALQVLNYCQCSSSSCPSNSCTGDSCYSDWYNDLYTRISDQSQLVISKQTDNISLNNQILSQGNINIYLPLTIRTATNPVIKPLQNQAMWDIRTVGSGAATGFYPFEAKNIPAVKNKLLFIARDLSTNYIGAELTGPNTAPVTADMPAFSSSFALKLDQKFDDGKPYSGNIIAGQNISDNTATTGKGCTTMTTSFGAMSANDLTANYNSTTNLATGCVVAAVINA